jgi:hypothetical protein
MQTFMPYAEYFKCAQVLDNKRLGKQRVEALQIFQILKKRYAWYQTNNPSHILNEKGNLIGFLNHPAVLMWEGHSISLMHYIGSMVYEWKRRGFENTIEIPEPFKNKEFQRPIWSLSLDFQIAHRSNLIRKFPEHYCKVWPGLRYDIEYIWPEKKHLCIVNPNK